MDLFLVVLGLLMVVEGPPGTPVELLFLRSQGHDDTCGSPMPGHAMTIEYLVPPVEGGFPQLVSKVLDATTEIRLWTSSPLGGAVALEDWDTMLDMADLVSGAKLRPDCAGPLAFETCVVDGRQLLAARLRLTGGSLRPVEFDRLLGVEFNTPVEVERPWSFSPVVASAATPPFASAPGPPSGVSPKRLTNALIFHARIDAGALVEIHHGQPHPVVLEKTSAPLCQQLGSQDCLVAILHNLPPDEAEEELHESTSDECHLLNRPVDTRCMIDRHFSLNYDLLEPKPRSDSILIPFLCLTEKEWGGEYPGESRCIPPKTSGNSGGTP